MSSTRGRRRTARGPSFKAVSALALAAVLAAGASAAASTPTTTPSFSGTLYFTTYQNQGYGKYGTPNVFTRTWSYDGSGQLTLGSYTPTEIESQSTATGTVYGWAYGNPLTTEKGADAILFGPSGNLLVTGQEANDVYSIDPQTGATLGTGATGKNTYHAAVDPSGASVWTFGQQGDWPGMPSNVPLPVGSGSPTLYGVTSSSGAPYYCPPQSTYCGLTQIAFVPGPTALDPSKTLYEGKYDIFYTASRDQGGGDFGYLIPPPAGSTNFTAVPLLTSQPWTHGLVWDTFSQSLIATGSDEVAQIDPQKALSSLVTYTLPAGTNGAPELDQVATDGAGHLFVADNHGDLFFMDYAVSESVASPTFVSHQFLADTLDDVAVALTPVHVTLVTGYTPGFWHNKNGHAVLDPGGTGSITNPAGGVTIGGGARLVTITTIQQSDVVLGHGLCTVIPGGCGTLSDTLHSHTLDTLGMQTLALTYNIADVAGYSGESIAALNGTSYVTSSLLALGLTPTSTVNQVLAVANSLIANSGPGGSTTQAEAGAMNALLGDALNQE